MAVIQAIIAYLFAFTAIALLISLGPIFIALILFKRSRDFFNNWLKAIIMFALQPVLLFSAIFFITMFVNEALQGVLVACTWVTVVPIYINFGSLGLFPVVDLHWYRPDFDFSKFWNFASSLLVLYLCVDLMGKLPAYIETISYKLIQGQNVGAGGKGLISNAGGIVDGAKGLLGMDKGSVERRKKQKDTEGSGEKEEEKGRTSRK